MPPGMGKSLGGRVEPDHATDFGSRRAGALRLPRAAADIELREIPTAKGRVPSQWEPSRHMPSDRPGSRFDFGKLIEVCRLFDGQTDRHPASPRRRCLPEVITRREAEFCQHPQPSHRSDDLDGEQGPTDSQGPATAAAAGTRNRAKITRPTPSDQRPRTRVGKRSEPPE